MALLRILGRGVRVLIASFLLVTTLGTSAMAQPSTERPAKLAFGAGLDVGLSAFNPHPAYADPSVRRNNTLPSVGLGIDVAGYYRPTPAIGVGFALVPTLYGGGPGGRGGLNFVLTPRFLWRPGPVHLAVDGGLLLSTFEDACSLGYPAHAPNCQPIRAAEPVAIGFGTSLSTLFAIYRMTGIEGEILLGPTFRFQYAHHDYQDHSGGFAAPLFQAVLGLHVFIDAASWGNRVGVLSTRSAPVADPAPQGGLERPLL